MAEGAVLFDGTDLAGMTEAGLRGLRGRRIGFVSQNPMTALDPVQRIGAQIDVVSRLHLGLSAKAARARTLDLMTQLRIPEAAAMADAYPHQLSGGMKQRIVIAMALAGDPDPVSYTHLDVYKRQGDGRGGLCPSRLGNLADQVLVPA